MDGFMLKLILYYYKQKMKFFLIFNPQIKLVDLVEVFCSAT